MNRIAPTLLLALSVASIGCATEGMESPEKGNGKADTLEDPGAHDLATVAFRSTPMAELSDPACENCDAIGFAIAGVDVPAPVNGDVLVKAVVRHANPNDLRAFMDLNSDHDFFEPTSDGHWAEDPSSDEGDRDSDAMIHSIALAPDSEGCETSTGHPQCFDVTFIASLGVIDVEAFQGGDAARWDFSVMDLDLNGATGQLRELSVIILDPSAL